ncbi:hypothetical protein ANN_26934 [Periplaneta americana]|uniref:Endonuclease/exonuclease/phosphatase domain-containing protein n=1 Tax=Periplaneta americana TaxID=6978 RepID=A0ABQ8RWX1_PERAM|nr:hypothetical protein ANN_26934 [Periplaneta americana]
MLLWNIEGLNGVRNIMPVNIFKEDITILTETFLTKEVDLPGFYNYHVLANQGNMGRPSGGITCLVKPWLAPITVLKRTPNLLMIKTNCITIIGGYFQPEFSAQEIIEAMNESIANTSTEEAVLIAGDFNCRTDIHNIKAAQTIAYLEQEGFKLINDPKEPTYISYNGASTIDLIFLNPRVTKISVQALTKSATTPLRKHIPILANLEISHKKEELCNSKKTTRHVDTTSLEEATEQIITVNKNIEDGKVNEAACKITDIIRTVQIVTEKR